MMSVYLTYVKFAEAPPRSAGARWRVILCSRDAGAWTQFAMTQIINQLRVTCSILEHQGLKKRKRNVQLTTN